MARLESAYSSLFGAESTKGNLYGGFYTLLGGAFLGLAALVLFLVANGQEGASLFRWREAALVLGSLALVGIFLGASIALPSRKGMRLVGLVGAGLCVLATILFSAHYPTEFNVKDSPNLEQASSDRTALDAGVYVVGLAVMLAALFTSLVGYYVDRIAPAAAGGRPGEAGYVDPFYDVPDSVIERDVDEAMKRYKYAWGEGATGSATGIQINIQDEFEAGVKVGGKGVARVVQLEAPQVEDATRALRTIRPKTDKELERGWVDDTTQALLASRKQKAVAQEAAAAHRRLTWWQRLLIWLGLKRPPVAMAKPAEK